jgi:hypothetical protein
LEAAVYGESFPTSPTAFQAQSKRKGPQLPAVSPALARLDYDTDLESDELGRDFG